MKRRDMLQLTTSVVLWLATGGAHATDPAPRLDERGLVGAVGKKVVRRYKLDDGYGLNFRTDEQPAFALEFRRSRVNVAWMSYRDVGMQALNGENIDLARKAFTYALGDAAAGRIMRAAQAGQRLQFDRDGYKVNVMASAGGQTLVTIFY